MFDSQALSKKLSLNVPIDEIFTFKSSPPIENILTPSRQIYNSILPHPKDIHTDISFEFLKERAESEYGGRKTDEDDIIIPKERIVEFISYIKSLREGEIERYYNDFKATKENIYYQIDGFSNLQEKRPPTERPNELYTN
ncbi:hypothetical protein TVAG_179770 [Trichomonas vaginalis G3]|uniref:Uncharacterized protein n=1 Tax=Trichomonas vaginalis (strain ATCC PRA-98 / G3) TaxID=412133 RepID=A2F459_TRIV3|nr:hypothetical protein TVAGG3_1002300 [Trichomonas vaginalis G3]EAY00306.1 hypothetical protein TVAG_179770 [Trichomonas vaginalis G3]KAI5490879.1 hypothetical protein TVAGG3_1002300 [Trichomonas vaginalis G3]|eukprot:XP_001313235.1 hypothetical protein [Trichomonas vaginalis G3]